MVPGPGCEVTAGRRGRLFNTTSEETEAIGIMSDNEGTAAEGPREDEQRLEGEIQKEINKLKYFLEETDDLIQIKD